MKDTELIRAKSFGIAAVAYSFNDLVRCECCCCCLPTPMALASGGSPMFPLVVHQPASPSIWPAVQSLRRGLSTIPRGDNVVRMWVQLKR